MEFPEYPWPADFPENVPPESAIDAMGEAFRLVANDPPTDKDFVGHNQEPHIKKKGNLKPSDYGTSMFRDLEQVECARNFHVALKKKKIAIGNLEPVHGKASKPNKNSHFETWLRLNTRIENNFKVVG
ncbi:hypothetical protein JMT66_20350 [Kosakonia cowanii]|uniref:hypothetical protein n=1 Tax=Kosakonia TaxID=1330547 RepID=UPI001909EB72|nr:MULTISPECIES: hypothetical protein [Kosakonia]MBK0015950.1 hypothetical protein [Kosakonia sp. S42]UGS45634.1 hypothetical protein JMT66_20350 [Kosakonia cowanii]